MADDKVNEAAWNMVKAVREANEAVADSVVVTQERNIKYAQSIYVNGIEVLRSQAESTRALTQELVEQYRKQQEAFQALVHESVDAYLSFFFAPMSYYKQALDFSELAAAK